MIQNRGNRFSGARIELDGQQFDNCTFERCAIVYKATGPYNMSGCSFNDCTYHFEGPAALTVRFMTDIYKMAPALIERTFDKIRLGI